MVLFAFRFYTLFGVLFSKACWRDIPNAGMGSNFVVISFVDYGINLSIRKIGNDFHIKEAPLKA
jgi:hypothetical protein